MDDTPIEPSPQQVPSATQYFAEADPQVSEPLAYEETPIIEPIKEPIASEQHAASIPPLVRPSSPSLRQQFSPIFFLILLIVVFVIGVGLSSFVRQFFPQTGIFVLPGPSPTPEITAAPDPYASWKTYSVISGTTHKPIDGIRFKLPPEIAELFCSGAGCSSQGTTFPGGTRFTVAPRGAGQVLTDYRGKQVTDFGGRVFAVSPTTIAERPALAFVGDFSGSTVTGYTFTKMRGVMISVTDTISLEVNHFSPTGVQADFASDDELFSKILETFTFTGLPIPTPSTSPATSSGS